MSCALRWAVCRSNIIPRVHARSPPCRLFSPAESIPRESPVCVCRACGRGARWAHEPLAPCNGVFCFVFGIGGSLMSREAGNESARSEAVEPFARRHSRVHHITIQLGKGENNPSVFSAQRHSRENREAVATCVYNAQTAEPEGTPPPQRRRQLYIRIYLSRISSELLYISRWVAPSKIPHYLTPPRGPPEFS